MGITGLVEEQGAADNGQCPKPYQATIYKAKSQTSENHPIAEQSVIKLNFKQFPNMFKIFISIQNLSRI